ncbi:MAG: hypothetical protein LBV13_06100, partial [Methanomassiliicoccaceae archaeon]|nr:hypothetical protein [Methanomassiliicoccaceae archaeon]
MPLSNRRPPAKELLYQKIRDALSHDPAVARCILDKDHHILKDKEKFNECFNDPFKPIGWMGNLFTLASLFMYAKYSEVRMGKGLNRDNKDMPNALFLNRILEGVQNIKGYFSKPSSAIRVLRVLDGMYDAFDMSFLVVKYMIVNSQIEAGFSYNSQTDKRKGLSKHLGFPGE